MIDNPPMTHLLAYSITPVFDDRPNAGWLTLWPAERKEQFAVIARYMTMMYHGAKLTQLVIKNATAIDQSAPRALVGTVPVCADCIYDERAGKLRTFDYTDATGIRQSIPYMPECGYECNREGINAMISRYEGGK